MSDKAKPEEGKKKKGGMMKIVLLAVLVLGGAGGGAYGLAASGIVGGSHEEKEDPEPKLILKGEEDPYSPPPAEGGKEGEAPFVYGEGGDKYRVAYYTFADEFTSNLRESDALVQMTLAASTRRDGRVLMWLKEHELAIRSKILVDLADTDEFELQTPEGKAKLQRRLTKSINDVLEAAEGFGGVDQVFFRTLIVQ